ncbi:hypothetical protein LguiA_019063 [Lonicera macranthoides]
MWSTTLANWKENLNKIALDVHDDDDEDEELSIYNNRQDSDRRISHSFARSPSVSNSPVANGFDSPSNSEIEQCKTEIKRLQESEAQIKALSVNYAALLKEKEDQISRLNQENGSLKQNLDTTSAALVASRNESIKTSTSSKESDLSPNRQHRAVARTRSIGSPTQNGIASKQDGLSNGIAHSSIQGNGKELADLLEEKNRSLAAMQATNELQIKRWSVELDKEHQKLANLQQRLQEEQKLNVSFQEELKSLKVDKDKTVEEMNKIHNELNKKISETKRLEMELSKRNNAETDDVENLKRAIATLEKENNNLKMERDELKASSRASNSSAHKASETSSKLPDSEKELQSQSFPGKEEMELSLRKLEKDLKDAFRERDKASQELSRLKQHLLDKESEESEKMDEDSKLIEELREINEYQRAQILHLEKALKQAIAGQDEVRLTNNNELQKSKEIIDDLNKRLRSLTNIIDAKNVELLNLQTALGQYYAEIEAKEHLEGDLALAREESARLNQLLQDAYEQGEISKREKEETLVKVSQAERMIAEGKSRVNKLEEDNGKLRRALEQSMTRLNRMSMDSDYFVDR